MIIGIDPGQDGGIAILGHLGNIIDGRKCSGPEDAWAAIVENAATNAQTIVIEEAPTHCPKAQTLRKLALSVGELVGYLRAKMPHAAILRPSAQNWQRKMLGTVPKGQTKEYALTKARNLWPEEKWLPTPRCKVPHDGIIDAALLAYYGHII